MPLSRGLKIVIVLAVLVRLGTLGFVLMYGPGEKQMAAGDGIGYVALAQSIAAGEGFTVLNENGERVLQTLRAPGLSLLLAPFMWIPHGIAVWAFVLSILAGIGMPLLSYRIGAHLFGHAIGMVAATLAAFELHMIWFSWHVLSEAPFILFFLAGVWLLLSKWESPRLELILAGGFLGYAILIRPPYLLIFGALLLAAALWYAFQRSDVSLKRLAFVALGMVLVIMPWSIRNHVHTGSFAISAVGWYNVYFDYVSAVIAAETGVNSEVIKNQRFADLPEGIPQGDETNPAHGAIYRDIALRELVEHPASVVKLEAMLMVTFFTNDSYYYYLRRFGFLPPGETVSGPRSATLAVLSRGTGALPHLLTELHRQLYIPIIGRAFTTSVFLLAIIGAFVQRRRPVVWLIVLLIGLTALTSSALGMGLEGRLRVPVQPFLFMLAGAGIFTLLPWVRSMYASVRTRANAFRRAL